MIVNRKKQKKPTAVVRTFAFEIRSRFKCIIIVQVLPIENSMRHPQRFLKSRPCGVLNSAMVLVVCLYSVAGFLGYLRFGDDTDGSITLNLPNDLYVYDTATDITLVR